MTRPFGSSKGSFFYSFVSYRTCNIRILQGDVSMLKKRQVQKSPISIGGEMNANLSYFSEGVRISDEE